MNIVEKRITPDKPKVIAKEQIEIYVPVAGYTYPGIAAYNSDDFVIINGVVELKYDESYYMLHINSLNNELYGKNGTSLKPQDGSIKKRLTTIELNDAQQTKDFEDLVASKGQPNGIASLNEQGQVPSEQLPPLDYLPLTGGTIKGDLTVSYSVKAQMFDTGSYSFADDGIWNGDYAIHPPQKNGTIALIEDLAPIETKIELINQALSQSGVIYKQPITQEYNERITADGANVLDGSKAVLKKVVGSTVKCENLIPFPYDFATYSANGTNTTVNSDGSFTIDGTATARVYKGWVNFTLKAGTYTLSANYVDTDGILVYLTDVKNQNDESKAVYLYHIKTTFTVDADTEYKMMIRLENGATFNKRKLEIMLNAGTTAKPFQLYFTGLKSASFAGIESMGSNLFNAKAIKSTDIKVNDDGSKILLPLSTSGNGQVSTRTTLAELCPSLKVGDVVYMDYEESVVSGNDMIYLTASADLWWANHPRTITEKDLASLVSFYGNRYVSGYTEQVTLLNFRIVRVKDTSFAPYIEPTVFNFPETELGKWDEIDFENKKIIEGSREIVLDGTENFLITDTINAEKHRFVIERFVERSGAISAVNSISSVYNSITSEQTYMCVSGLSISGMAVFIYDETYSDKTVSDFKAHLAELYASGNPVVVRYLLATPTETPFTAEQSASGDEYTAKKGGTERVIGNDNAKFGAENTLTQDYILVTEVK